MGLLTDEESRRETIPANSNEGMEEEISMSYKTWKKALILYKRIREPILEKDELLRVWYWRQGSSWGLEGRREGMFWEKKIRDAWR